MKRPTTALFVLALPLILSGCAQYVWMKPNGDPSTFNADSYSCKQSAMDTAPPVFETYGHYPIHRHPDEIRTLCVDKGSHTKCKTIYENHGYVPPPRTVDLNEGNRSEMYSACMAAQGWVLQLVESE